MHRDDWTCRFCGDKNNTLHVHHLTYLPNKEPWDYPEDFLITVCEACHKEEERLKSEDMFLLKRYLLIGLDRRSLYSLATELTRYFMNPKARQSKFIDLMEMLYDRVD